MSSVKNIIKGSFEKDKYGEIHPLTHIKSKDTKLKKWMIFLSILTVLNISLLVYIEKNSISFSLAKENKTYEESLKVAKNNNKIDKQSQNENILQNKLKDNLKENKLNYDSLENLSVRNLKIPRTFLEKQKIPSLNLKDSKISKFDYYYKKAKYYEKKKDILSSLYFYRKAYNINPDYYILYKIALFHYRLQRYKASLKYSKQIISNVNDEILLDKTYYLIAKTYERLGSLKKAKLILEEAYYKLTNPDLVAKALGKYYLKENDLFAAAEIFENLAEKGSFEYAIKAGKIYEKLGEKQLALNMYKKALELSNGRYKNWLQDKIKFLSN